MPRHRHRERATALALAGVCLVVAYLLGGNVDDDRQRLRIKPETEGEALGAEETVGTVMIGPARGFINLQYWMRALSMTEERETAEVLDLYRRIARLQPRNPRVWRQISNILIYDLSEEEVVRALRWRWVDEGIDLLYQGLTNNPKSTVLWQEIASAYQFKGPQYMLEILARELGRDLLTEDSAWLDLARTLLDIVNGATLEDRVTVRRSSQTQAIGAGAVDMHTHLYGSEITPAMFTQPITADERDQLRRAIDVIGMNVLYAQSLNAFPEYTALTDRMRVVFRELDRFAARLQLLFLRRQFREHGADPRLVGTAVTRALTLAFPMWDERESQRVGTMAVTCISLLPPEGQLGDLDRRRLLHARDMYGRLLDRARSAGLDLPTYDGIPRTGRQSD